MQIIETTAPISLENLKLYFQDKNLLYVIDYSQSDLKGDKLFIYLSNLDLPCDLKFSNNEEVLSAVESYLSFTHILHIPLLEKLTISLLHQFKGITIEPIWPEDFIQRNAEILSQWVQKLDALTLFNLYTVDVDEYKDFIRQFPVNETNTITGINFVSLLKHQDFYTFYNKIDKTSLNYYPVYFNEYMFKGNNLYHYWANENNPMFLLTWGIASGELNIDQYIQETNKDIQELENVSSSA